jgi:hypothetical protein
MKEPETIMFLLNTSHGSSRGSTTTTTTSVSEIEEENSSDLLWDKSWGAFGIYQRRHRRRVDFFLGRWRMRLLTPLIPWFIQSISSLRSTPFLPSPCKINNWFFFMLVVEKDNVVTWTALKVSRVSAHQVESYRAQERDERRELPQRSSTRVLHIQDCTTC